jgi:anti-sigma factor RsiW
VNCQQVGPQLADYTAGFLGSEERARLEAHVGECADCAQHLAELRALDGLMASDRVSASQALVARVMRHVRPAAARPRHAWVYMLDGLGPFVAAVVLVPVCALLLVSLLPSGATSQATVDSLLQQPMTLGAAVFGLGVVAGGMLWLSKSVGEALA